jgi:hypothetical protein
VSGPPVYSKKLGTAEIALEPGNDAIIFTAAEGTTTILRSVVLSFLFGTDLGQAQVILYDASTGAGHVLMDTGNNSDNAAVIIFDGRVVMVPGDILHLFNPAGADGGSAYAWASGYQLAP